MSDKNWNELHCTWNIFGGGLNGNQYWAGHDKNQYARAEQQKKPNNNNINNNIKQQKRKQNSTGYLI